MTLIINEVADKINKNMTYYTKEQPWDPHQCGAILHFHSILMDAEEEFH